MHIINDGKELNRIIFLLLMYLLGCNSVPNNESKINVSSEAEKRVHELINKNVVASAEIYNDPSTSRGSDKIFVFLDSLQTGIDFKNIWNPDPVH